MINIKQQFIITIFMVCINISFSDELNALLSDTQTKIYEYDIQKNNLNSDILENEWIKPIELKYEKNYSEQYIDTKTKTGSFSIGVNQPIFKFGGIHYGIRHAKALRMANKAQIDSKKRALVIDAVKYLFEIRKIKLQQQKQLLLIKNDKIDIKQKHESYKAGLLESSFLNQAILTKNRDNNILLELETRLAQVEHQFALISDKNPSNITLPKFKLLSMREYENENLDLLYHRFNKKVKAYKAKMTWTKYLPTFSLQARYVSEDINPLYVGYGINEKYYYYGFMISMPLDMNMFSKVEADKVMHLRAETEMIENQKNIKKEYLLVQNKLKFINKKIKLAKRDAKLYKRLYKVTKNNIYAGEKTLLDSKIMFNTLKVRELDQKIYDIDKQITLLSLYRKMSV